MIEEQRIQRAYASPEEYAAANPLGGPARIFDAMAERVRAGEDFYAVLADYGFCETKQLEIFRAALIDIKDGRRPLLAATPAMRRLR